MVSPGRISPENEHRLTLKGRTSEPQKQFGGFWRIETFLVASCALITIEIMSPSARKHTELADLNRQCRWSLNFRCYPGLMPVPVAARSKVYFCCRSPAEIVGSNPTGGMDVCVL